MHEVSTSAWQSQAARDQVSCWAEGVLLPRGRPRGLGRPTQYLGVDGSTPKAPGHSYHAHRPQTPHPSHCTLTLSKPLKPSLASPSERTPSRTHPSLISACGNYTHSSKPNSNSPSSKRSPEPPLLPAGSGKSSSTSPAPLFQHMIPEGLERCSEVRTPVRDPLR